MRFISANLFLLDQSWNINQNSVLMDQQESVENNGESLFSCRQRTVQQGSFSHLLLSRRCSSLSFMKCRSHSLFILLADDASFPCFSYFFFMSEYNDKHQHSYLDKEMFCSFHYLLPTRP